MNHYFAFFRGQTQIDRLRRFNFIMRFLHLIQAIAMIFLAVFVIDKIAEFQPKSSNFSSLMPGLLKV